jgi:undecaprenyl-diphosphatase
MHEPSIWQAFVLGTIQGLTEFLPVSSSAHLSLTPWVFGWQPAGLAFDVSLHIGTLVALVWYFRAEWAKVIRGSITLLKHR